MWFSWPLLPFAYIVGKLGIGHDLLLPSIHPPPSCTSFSCWKPKGPPCNLRLLKPLSFFSMTLRPSTFFQTQLEPFQVHVCYFFQTKASKWTFFQCIQENTRASFKPSLSTFKLNKPFSPIFQAFSSTLALCAPFLTTSLFQVSRMKTHNMTL
jgi:hypothetical protein